jgi:hypothetical protein
MIGSEDELVPERTQVMCAVVDCAGISLFSKEHSFGDPEFLILDNF